MIAFARTDTSLLARWWWTVDRVTIAALMLLILIGAILTLAASPTVAERVGLPPYHFVMRQAVFLIPAIAVMVGVSLMPPLWVRRMAVVAFLLFLVMLALTLVVGSEIKGARRWIDIAGFSVQPSEFIRPTFAVVAALVVCRTPHQSGFSRQPPFHGVVRGRGRPAGAAARLRHDPDGGCQCGASNSSWRACPGCG